MVPRTSGRIHGSILSQQRKVVLVGGTGTGKTYISVAIAHAVIRNAARGRFLNVVDLVNGLEAEARAGRAGRLAEHLMRLDFVILDELGYLPFAQSGGQLRFHLSSQALRADLRHRHHQPRIRGVADRLRGREDGHRAARSAHPSRPLAIALERMAPRWLDVETGNDSRRIETRA